MFWLLAALLAILVLGLAVIVYAAYPHRGREVPIVPILGERMASAAHRLAPQEPAPPQGVLAAHPRARRMQARFERLERCLDRSARTDQDRTDDRRRESPTG